MKTNKITKLMIALLAAFTIFSLTATAFAQTEPSDQRKSTETQGKASDQTAPVPEKPGHKDGKNRPGRPMKYDDDRFEDWFENRIEEREHDVDFSKLPENPTDEEMLNFFKENFLDEVPEQKKDSKPERPMKKDRKADRFEDWFEDRIDAREDRVDFSQLGEDPTDEEIVEFFRNNFMGDDSTRISDCKCDEEAMKNYSFNESGKPFGGHKDNPRHPYQPNPGQAPKNAPAPQTPDSAPAEPPADENNKDKA